MRHKYASFCGARCWVRHKICWVGPHRAVGGGAHILSVAHVWQCATDNCYLVAHDVEMRHRSLWRTPDGAPQNIICGARHKWCATKV